MSSRERTRKSDGAGSSRKSEAHDGEAGAQRQGLGATIQRARADRRALTPQSVIQLQKTIGNRATRRLLTAAPGPVIQRKEAAPLRFDGIAARIEELSPAPHTDPAGVRGAAAQALGGSSGPLPHVSTIQEAFGKHDIRGVKAHTDAAAGEGARAMGAEAFASGERTAFAGAPTLYSAAHEAAHVVQQRGGVNVPGGVGAAGDVYERHADEVARRVTQGQSAEPLLDRFAGPGSSASGSSAPIQMLGFYDMQEHFRKSYHSGVSARGKHEEVMRKLRKLRRIELHTPSRNELAIAARMLREVVDMCDSTTVAWDGKGMDPNRSWRQLRQEALDKKQEIEQRWLHMPQQQAPVNVPANNNDADDELEEEDLNEPQGQLQEQQQILNEPQGQLQEQQQILNEPQGQLQEQQILNEPQGQLQEQQQILNPPQAQQNDVALNVNPPPPNIAQDQNANINPPNNNVAIPPAQPNVANAVNNAPRRMPLLNGINLQNNLKKVKTVERNIGAAQLVGQNDDEAALPGKCAEAATEIVTSLRSDEPDDDLINGQMQIIGDFYSRYSMAGSNASEALKIGKAIENAVGPVIRPFIIDPDVPTPRKIKLWKASEENGHALHNSVVGYFETEREKVVDKQNDSEEVKLQNETRRTTLRAEEKVFTKALVGMYGENLRDVGKAFGDEWVNPEQDANVNEDDADEATKLAKYVGRNTMLARILVNAKTTAHATHMAEVHPNFWGLFVTPPQKKDEIDETASGDGTFKLKAPSSKGAHIFNAPGHTRALYMRTIKEDNQGKKLPTTFATKGGGLDLTRRKEEYVSTFEKLATAQKNLASNDEAAPLPLFHFSAQGTDDAHKHAGYGDWSMANKDFKNFNDKYKGAQAFAKNSKDDDKNPYGALSKAFAQSMSVATLANTLENRDKLDEDVLGDVDKNPDQMPTQITTVAEAESSRRLHRRQGAKDQYRLFGAMLAPLEGPTFVRIPAAPKKNAKKGEVIFKVQKFADYETAAAQNSQPLAEISITAQGDWSAIEPGPEVVIKGALLIDGNTELLTFKDLTSEVEEYKLATKEMASEIGVPAAYRDEIDNTRQNAGADEKNEYKERVDAGYALLCSVLGGLAVFLELGDSTGKIGDSFEARNISTGLRDADQWGMGQLRKVKEQGQSMSGVATLTPKDIYDASNTLGQVLSSVGLDKDTSPQLFKDVEQTKAVIDVAINQIFNKSELADALDIGRPNSANKFEIGRIKSKLDDVTALEFDDTEKGNLEESLWTTLNEKNVSVDNLAKLEALLLETPTSDVEDLFDVNAPKPENFSQLTIEQKQDYSKKKAKRSKADIAWKNSRDEFKKMMKVTFKYYVASNAKLVGIKDLFKVLSDSD